MWAKTAQAVKERNHELATEEKTKIEEVQREEAAKRANDGVEWHPRLFRRVKGGPGGSEEGEEDLEWIINATMLEESTLCRWATWRADGVAETERHPRSKRRK